MRPGAPSPRGLERLAPPRPRLYRGAIVNPHGDFQHDFFADGGLAVDATGTIVALGKFETVRRAVGRAFREVDGTRHGERPVILPSFADPHIHWVQHAVRGQFGGALLPWLSEKIWPEESRYGSSSFADAKAEVFWNDLAQQGTLIAAVYSSIHAEAFRAALQHAQGYAVIGNVLMTQNSPDSLRQDPTDALQMTAALARDYGPSYAVTPRFAPTCGMGVLRRGAKIARKYGSWIQTHLSENRDELRWVAELFPGAESYTDVYRLAGLLGPRTILGHAIHITDAELSMLAVTGTKIAHAPTSNAALESGRMPLSRIRRAGIPFALSSDVGAGPSHSMLHVMQGYCATHSPYMKVSPTEALYRATLAGAQLLNLGEVTGNLSQGKKANFVVVKNSGTGRPHNAHRLLSGILEGDQDDLENAVQQTYFEGRRIFNKRG